jgi:hypothetical protein
MAANYVLLERIELNASAASVTFANIPQSGYTDLKVVASTRGAASGPAEANTIYFNGDTTNANYPAKRLLGSGTAASSDQTTTIKPGFFNNLAGTTASTFANSEVYIPNYTGSNSKSFSVDTATENNGTEAYMAFVAGRWTGTAAITSITFTPESGNNFVANSTFSLYGLAAVGTTPATAPKAEGGDSFLSNGTYWYHVFTSTGTFRVNSALSCDVLVVAGGGSGGANSGGGGGGAGGLIYQEGISTAGGTYAVTIGAGGASVVNNTGNGNTGTDTTFNSLTAKGGGYGAQNIVQTNGGTGGSGGGGNGGTDPVGSGGTANQTSQSGNSGTYGFGSAGGTGVVGQGDGGGGGGAGGSGGNGVLNDGGGAGGVGKQYSTFATATATGANSGYYAGGGSGNSESTFTLRSGGLGGGGTGGKGTTMATNGTANTGGGGGGASRNTGSSSGSGGSGIVIIRYAV